MTLSSLFKVFMPLASETESILSTTMAVLLHELNQYVMRKGNLMDKAVVDLRRRFRERTKIPSSAWLLSRGTRCVSRSSWAGAGQAASLAVHNKSEAAE